MVVAVGEAEACTRRSPPGIFIGEDMKLMVTVGESFYRAWGASSDVGNGKPGVSTCKHAIERKS